MCQISVVVRRDGYEEKIMDNVTGLEVTPGGVVLSAFFEEPRTLADVAITRIDFLGGKVVLGDVTSAQHSGENRNGQS